MHGFHVAEDHVGVGSANTAYVVGAEPKVRGISLLCGFGGYDFHHLFCVSCGGAYLKAQASEFFYGLRDVGLGGSEVGEDFQYCCLAVLVDLFYILFCEGSAVDLIP